METNDPASGALAAAVATCGYADRVAVDAGSRTIAGIDRGHLRTWDARTGRCLLEHNFARGGTIALAFDRTGDRLALLLSKGTLVVFERHARDGLTWLQPAHSYAAPIDDDEYSTKLAFDGDRSVILTTPAGVLSEGSVRIVEVSGVTASSAGRTDENEILQAQTVAAAGSSSEPVRLTVPTSGGRQTIVSRNAGAGTGRITGAGLMTYWDDAGIERFEFDFAGDNVRFLAVRNPGPWTLLGTSTVDALGREGWYGLAAALGACYDGKVTAFERGVVWPA